MPIADLSRCDDMPVMMLIFPAGATHRSFNFPRRGAELACETAFSSQPVRWARVLAAICCMTPLLVGVFGAVGPTAWLANPDYVLIPALILCLAVVVFGLYRTRLHHG
jgi:hypothetical protein